MTKQLHKKNRMKDLKAVEVKSQTVVYKLYVEDVDQKLDEAKKINESLKNSLQDLKKIENKALKYYTINLKKSLTGT